MLSNDKVNIYLAGKINGSKWKLIDHRSDFNFVASDASEHGSDQGTWIGHGWGMAVPEFDTCNNEYKELLEDKFINVIKNCRHLLAYLDTPTSYGSIAEIATAAAYAKPSHVIIKAKLDVPFGDGYGYGDDEDSKMFDAYWFVCSFPRVKVYTVHDMNQARAVANQILDKIRDRPSKVVIKPDWKKKPATEKQLVYLKALGYKGEPPRTKAEAGRLISEYQQKV